MKILTIIIFLFPIIVYAQTYTGKVVDNLTGEAMVGAYITDVNNNENVVCANAEGKYTIQLQANSIEKVSVSVSFIGYKTTIHSFPAVENGFNTSSLPIIKMTQTTNDIDEVVVVSGTTKIKFDEVYSITTIKSELIAEDVQANLIDVLETVPGLYKKSDYHSPIVLRGLKGKRLLITLNGNRRMGSTASGFTGHKANIYALEKVEVIKGPASVKYGPGAIAGVINMVTLSPFVEKGLGGQLRTYYGTNNNEKMTQFELMGSNDKHAFTIAARYHDADNYYSADKEEQTNSFHTDKDLAGSYAFRPSQRFSLTVESSVRLGGSWGCTTGFNGCDYLDRTTLTDNNYHIATTAIFYPDNKIERMEAALYFDIDERDDETIYTDIGTDSLSGMWEHTYDNYYGGWRFHAIMPFMEKGSLTVGTDGVHYQATTPYSFTDYFDDWSLDVVSLNEAGLTMGGLFAENEMLLAQGKINWTLGLRSDFANVYEGQRNEETGEAPRNENFFVFNGTTGARYEYRKSNFLSLNIARTCRMPDITELFVETTTNDSYLYGNADLNPEYGMGVDLGLRGEILKNLRYDLTLYSNFLNNYIGLEHKSATGMPGYAYEYVNIDRTHIYGSELSLGYSINGLLSSKDTWQYSSYFVITKGYEIDDGNSWMNHAEPLINIPPFNTRQELVCRYHFNPKWLGFVGANFLFFARRTEYPSDSYETGRYTLLGGKTGMRYLADNGIRYNLSVVGSNLSDECYCAFESIVYGMGRNFKIMLNIEFGSKRRKIY